MKQERSMITEPIQFYMLHCIYEFAWMVVERRLHEDGNRGLGKREWWK
jgi:hypothetical protein